MPRCDYLLRLPHRFSLDLGGSCRRCAYSRCFSFPSPSSSPSSIRPNHLSNAQLEHKPDSADSGSIAALHPLRRPAPRHASQTVTVTVTAVAAVMDRLPSKFRRKPKPPAIQTSLSLCNGALSDTADSITSIDSSISRTSSPNPTKKLSLRNLKLPRSAKRARSSPPAELASSTPPSAAVVGQDGVAHDGAAQKQNAIVSQDRPSSSPAAQSNGHRLPVIPAFLTLSATDILSKFSDLHWAETFRQSRRHRPQGSEDKWRLYSQTPAAKAEKGIMDRYSNIKPWAFNRVKLQVPEGQLDYVNASPVVIESPHNGDSLPPLKYIATQGPTAPSLDYVWRMVAEQLTSPAVIIQLTTMTENGLLKCHQYFPDDQLEEEDGSTWTLNKNDVWGDGWKATLTHEATEELAGGAIERRKLLLRVGDEAEDRIVWHFLYTCWPDFAAPTLDDLESLFELMKVSREHVAPLEPRIIHCSAGIGRTGTFICLEHLIRELEAGALEAYNSSSVESPDLIFTTVDSLREQRRGMVQSDTQYQFIYEVMRKLWLNKYDGEAAAAAAAAAAANEPAAKRLEVPDPSVESISSSEAESSSDTAPEEDSTTKSEP